MCTAASATRPTRCSKNAWPRSKAARARSPPPAGRPRCTWRSPRSPAPARTSWPAPRCTAARTTCCTTRCARFGIETTFVKPGDIDGWRAAIRPNTRLLFGETLGNPGLDVLDIPTVGAIAHDAGLPLLVDSTFTTPWLMKPFEHGADLIFHSATKFLSGHGTVIGGVLVDSGAVRLGRVGTLPRTGAALQRLSRHGVQRGKQRRRLPAARAPRGPARLRRLHEPAHRLADPARHRDAAAAHGAACREHAQGRRLPRRARDGRPRRLPRARRPPQPRAGEEAAAARLRLGVQLRPARARASRARPSSRR